MSQVNEHINKQIDRETDKQTNRWHESGDQEMSSKTF